MFPSGPLKECLCTHFGHVTVADQKSWLVSIAFREKQQASILSCLMNYDHTERTVVSVSKIKASCYLKHCYGGIKAQAET